MSKKTDTAAALTNKMASSLGVSGGQGMDKKGLS